MADSSIEWTDATWNPTTGCDRTSPGCDSCLAPDTPVLMADMSWKPIGKIVPGDQVVGFTAEPSLGQNRVFERATVIHAWTTQAEAVELDVDGRQVVASVDHRFLAHTRPYWREAERLNLRTGVVDLGISVWHPRIDSHEYLAGYVAGATGGDGTFRVAGPGKNGTKQSYFRVAVDAEDRAILDRLIRAFTVLELADIHLRPFDGGAGSPGFGREGTRRPMSKVETRRMGTLVALRDEVLPERDDNNWKAGFLAGFLDTDGCHSGKNLRFHQTKDNGLLDATSRYIADLGFASAREDFRRSTGRSERLVGNLAEKIRFLSTVQPALTRKSADFYGRRFPSKHATKITGVRRLGMRDLVDIQTTSGTFIANGLATHNCYALAMAGRLKAMGQAKYQNDGDPRTSGPGFALTLHPDTLELPKRWTRPRMIFVNSMSDLFHPEVPLDFIVRVFAVMRETPQHTYQVLTKRSKRLAQLSGQLDWPSNVWMGVSVENQTYAFRVNHLRAVPAAVRFLSLEPLLGPVAVALDGIDWLIAGGESGPAARPVDEAWVTAIREACVASGTPFFFKQWGGRTPKSGGRLLDGHTWDEYPTTEVRAAAGVGR